jgi:hypothetical protein
VGRDSVKGLATHVGCAGAKDADGAGRPRSSREGQEKWKWVMAYFMLHLTAKQYFKMEFIVLIVAILISYQVGKRHGLVEANKSGTYRGTWIEITSTIKIKYRKGTAAKYLQPGTQAFVKGRDKWGRISIWIAKPWADIYKWRSYHDIDDFSKFRIKSISSIDKKTYDEAVESLLLNEKFDSEFRSRFIPPGWDEIQRVLNG